MPPVAAVVGGAASAAGAIAGAVGGGGSSSSSGYTLPPELAMQMLSQFQKSLQGTQQQMQQNQQMIDIYNQRSNIINQTLQGSLPNDVAMKSLQQSTTQLAQMFGGNTMQAIQQGFIDKNSAEAAGLIKEQAGQMQNYDQGFLDNLKTMESQDYVDPALKHQQEDQRRQLQQDLQRQGVSPAGQMAALNQFDRNASDQLFTRSQDLKNQTFQQAQMAIGAAGSAFGQYASGVSGAAQLNLQGQQQQFNQAQQGYQNITGALSNAQQGYAGLSTLQGNQFNMGQTSLQASRQLNADTQNAFNQIGQYKFNNDVNRSLEMGLLGNQTVYQQTGYNSGGGIGGLGTAEAAYQSNQSQKGAQTFINQFGQNNPYSSYVQGGIDRYNNTSSTPASSSNAPYRRFV